MANVTLAYGIAAADFGYLRGSSPLGETLGPGGVAIPGGIRCQMDWGQCEQKEADPFLLPSRGESTHNVSRAPWRKFAYGLG